MRRAEPILVAGLLLSTLLACRDPCRQLAERLCQCQETSVAETACKQQVSQDEGRQQLTDQDQQVCADLLPGCDCHTIHTDEGKRACGLAR
jgi:hypothetical protein